MRIITPEYEALLRKNRVYQLIMNTPPPDLSHLRREAEAFARWIAREHKKERELLAKASV